MDYENNLVIVEKFENKVAKVTLNNPPFNVVTLPLIKEMNETLSQIAVDTDIKVVVLTGSGNKGFCAGSDLQELLHIRKIIVENKLRQETAAYDKIEFLPKPVIAAIEGVVCGGGAEMAMCCDIRIIAENSKVGFPEIKLGVFPGSGGPYRLPKLVGYSKAVELMYLGEFISAQEAKEIGWATHVVPAGTTVQFAIEMANKIADKPAPSLRAIKEATRTLQYKKSEECSEANFDFCDPIFKLEDAGEGISAFIEKRVPKFTDR